MARPLLAVDGPSVLFRAFYALPKSITDDKKRPVNALLGTVNIVLREVIEHDPRVVVFCFGEEAADYRVELYEPYHADRPELPDELVWQWDEAPALFESLGWLVDSEPGLEADDLMHSYALAESKARGNSLILTGDRDMFQCVAPRCTVLYLRTGGAAGAEIVDAAGVEGRYGIPPALVPDFIALRGDASDGLPGARGIGDKTAAELLRRHGSLEATVANAGGERPRVAGALTEQAEDLETFKEIATLQTVDVERPPSRPTDFSGGSRAARALGMNRLAERLEKLADERH
jgi:5'-3' exonuclease